MKLADSLSHMIADFAGMNKSPEFRPQTPQKLEQERDSQFVRGPMERKHSIHISVGTESIPVLVKRDDDRRSSDSKTTEEAIQIQKKYYKAGRRQSAPCISSTAARGNLKKKLQLFKQNTSKEDSLEKIESDSEQSDSAPSTTVYRV